MTAVEERSGRDGRGRDAWWPRAALRRDQDLDADRTVSWLDLFFDLVFVVVLSRLAHDLAHDPDGGHVLDFALLFAAAFWAWNAFTFYTERFESDGLEQRVSVFAAMGAVAALAVWSEDGLGERYAGFATCCAAVRLVNMAQWVRAGAHVPAFAPVAARFVAGFALCAALLVVAGTLEGDARRAVFAAAVLVDAATPLATLGHQARLPRLSTSRFPERFGLFTILVLGESVVGVVTGVSDVEEAGALGTAQALAGALGLLVVIGLWWSYFDFVARRPPRARLATSLGWVYLHAATLGAIAVTGPAVSVVIAGTVGGGEHGDGTALLTGAVALALLGTAALETTLERAVGEPAHRVLSPALKAGPALLIGGLGHLDLGWTAVGTLVMITVGLAVPAVYGATVWYAPGNTHRTPAETSTP